MTALDVFWVGLGGGLGSLLRWWIGLRVGQLFMGIGVALFFMPTLTILMSDLPPHQIADGAGLATYSARLAEHQGRLSARIGDLFQLVSEADFIRQQIAHTAPTWLSDSMGNSLIPFETPLTRQPVINLRPL